MRINVKAIADEGEALRGSEPGSIVESVDPDISFPKPGGV